MTVKELKEYKNSLYTSHSKNLFEFEKNFLWISIAILTFTITFIREIVTIESAVCIILLYFSWAFLIISIGFMMFAFFKSSLASDELWKLVDEYLLDNELFKDEKELSDSQNIDVKSKVNKVFYTNKKKLKKYRFISIYAFLIGITILSIYVSANISHENKKHIKDHANILCNDILNVKIEDEFYKPIKKVEIMKQDTPQLLLQIQEQSNQYLEDKDDPPGL